MGIFDDAIRQHLDLKRRQGAEETELKQLEDEAFGPPARPGDPEFGDTDEQAMADSSDEVATAPEAEGPATAEAEAQAPSATELVADPVSEPDFELEPEASEPEVGAEGSAFTTAEREAIADQPTTFFDQQIGEAEPALELEDLDLDLEEELEEVGGLEEELEEAGALEEAEVSEPEPEPESEPEPEPVEPEPVEPEPVEPEPTAEADVLEPSEPEPAGEGDGDDNAAEDVLEETPEFLRDNPDDDELWFEQGKPKDFDF